MTIYFTMSDTLITMIHIYGMPISHGGVLATGAI